MGNGNRQTPGFRREAARLALITGRTRRVSATGSNPMASAGFPISHMCRVLCISQSGFFA